MLWWWSLIWLEAPFVRQDKHGHGGNGWDLSYDAYVYDEMKKRNTLLWFPNEFRLPPVVAVRVVMSKS